jgi:hypothetical protein
MLSGAMNLIASADIVRSESKWREVLGIEHQLQGCRTYSAWHFYDRLWDGHNLNIELLPC